MALITGISCGMVFAYRNFKKLKQDVEVNFCVHNVVLFINKCKSYCKGHEQSGTIEKLQNGSGFVFKHNSLKIDTLIVPSGIEVESMNSTLEKIEIDRLGFTSSACTIKINTNSGKKRVTIQVGSGYASVKVE